jgi:putative ABC transport system substrate-binding protein
MVNKRLVLEGALLLCLLPLSIGCKAQGIRVYRIGWLAPGQQGDAYRAFLQRAKELGYSEGKNLAIDYRWAQSAEDGRASAEALVRSKVDLIIAQAPTALHAAKSATRTIPIVTFFIGDPIRMGITRSLARPGGNITGFTWDAGVDGAGKSLELLKEIVPRAAQIGVVWNLDNESHPFYLRDMNAYARTLRLSLLSIGVRRPEEFEGAFQRMADRKVSAMMIFSDPLTVRNREGLTALLGRFPIPAMWGSAQWPLQGALITSGPNVADQPRGVAEYMDRIFKGASPAALPFQQPTTFDLILDAKVAKTLGLIIPPALLLRADKVVGQ